MKIIPPKSFIARALREFIIPPGFVLHENLHFHVNMKNPKIFVIRP